MGIEITEGVFFYPLKPIVTTGGRVMHAIKSLDESLPTFGECYFSTAENNRPKAWRMHTEMICNLFVPSGKVKFVFYSDKNSNAEVKQITEFLLSDDNYGRLIINPGVWYGFSGVGEDGKESIVLNVSNIQHNPTESLRLEPGDPRIPYNW